MTAPRTLTPMRLALLATLTSLSALLGAPTAHAVSQVPALGRAVATPAAFVADWDGGHTDSTAVAYRVAVTSDVEVTVVDARGVVRRQLLDARQSPGLHDAVWDGRDETGSVLPIGTYTVQVVATPITAGATVRTRGFARSATARRSVVVALRAAPVAVRAVRLSRGSIGRARTLAATKASFTLSRAAFVNAAIVGTDGRVWRTLSSGRHPVGPQVAAWSGTDAAGAPVPDGMYELLVAASGGAGPTQTLRVPLRVDRTLPKVNVAPTLTARLSSGDPVLPLDVAIDETATIRVKVGTRGVKVVATAGTRRFSIRGRTLGIVSAKRSRVVPVYVSATDLTGNVTAARVNVTVPAAVAHTAPKPPRKADPAPHGPPVASDKLAWPLHRGIQVNSPFGARWGRMHTGIDLQADIGTPVFAAGDGRVSFVGEMGGYGNLVIIDHPNALQTYYAHFSSFTPGVVVGDTVPRGTQLGLSGCTGSCTGPHLHFEVRVGGNSTDPMPYLPAS
ncbi:MAG: peptidoglycan DD-metalloendopeptidase family protein [Thermoleophilia bacterium]|nr:peptidoglycan DD-metalloendopeptidase family protein [Thermoleophilia bacterium]